MEKYLRLMLENDWACAAFSLDPFNRGEALKNILDAYGKGSRYSKVEQWIRKRIEKHTAETPPAATPTVSDSQKAKETRRVSEFLTCKRNTGGSQAHEPVD